MNKQAENINLFRAQERNMLQMWDTTKKQSLQIIGIVGVE